MGVLRAVVLCFATGGSSVSIDGGPIILPLSRRTQDVGRRGSNLIGRGQRSYYVGNVRIGGTVPGTQPQDMRVFFDTGSGQVILDSNRCGSIACRQHRRYDSSHAADVLSDGSPAAAGRGDRATIELDTNDQAPGRVKGDFVHDRLCLGMERYSGARREACANLSIVAATEFSDELFTNAPFDGIVGLGLDVLSISPDFNFFGQLSTKGFKSQFALFVPSADQADKAEIAFGGYNADRLSSPLMWASVKHPDAGFWQVGIKAVKVGSMELDLCTANPCVGIIDSSSSRLGIPEEALVELDKQVSLDAPGSTCFSSTGPDLTFTLADGFELVLTARDYISKDGDGCAADFHPLTHGDRTGAGSMTKDHQVLHEGGFGVGTFVLGEPFLRKYYTVYDWHERRLGFGVAAGRATASRSTQAILLMQCKTEVKKV